jgi:DNA repair exonuclease SbcCD nuclease subunit
MNIAITGDFHIHNYPHFAKPWREGLNSRVKHIYEVVGEWLPQRLVQEYRSDILIHTGDWHWNANNDYFLVNIARDVGYNLESKVDGVVALHGNHDTVSSDETSHNAYPYFTSPEWSLVRCFDDVVIFPIGYNTQLPTPSEVNGVLRSKRLIFVLHKDIEGGRTSNGFIYKARGQVQIADLLRLKEAFPQSVFFAGHYHQHQMISKLVHCVGAPLQHNFGDENSLRGFVVYNTETGVARFVTTDVGPKFVSCDITTARNLYECTNEKERERLYVSISVSSNNTGDYAQAEKLIHGGLNAVINVTDKEPEKKQQPRVSGRLCSDVELLSRWFKEKHPELSASDRARLIRIAESL